MAICTKKTAFEGIFRPFFMKDYIIGLILAQSSKHKAQSGKRGAESLKLKAAITKRKAGSGIMLCLLVEAFVDLLPKINKKRSYNRACICSKQYS